MGCDSSKQFGIENPEFLPYTKKEPSENKERRKDVYEMTPLIKKTIGELHKMYLNPTGKFAQIIADLIHTDSYELEELINGCARLEAKALRSQLEFSIQNIVYLITDIMPTKGILGTDYQNSGIYEMIREGNQYPDGYFMKDELERLQFTEDQRITAVGNAEAFMILLGVFVTRGFITTLLLKPAQYRVMPIERYTGLAESNLRVLATTLMFIVRRLTIVRGMSPMPIPLELRKFLFSDEEMISVYGKMSNSIKYAEDLLRRWGQEYVSRLMTAQKYEAQGI